MKRSSAGATSEGTWVPEGLEATLTPRRLGAHILWRSKGGGAAAADDFTGFGGCLASAGWQTELEILGPDLGDTLRPPAAVVDKEMETRTHARTREGEPRDILIEGQGHMTEDSLPGPSSVDPARDLEALRAHTAAAKGASVT